MNVECWAFKILKVLKIVKGNELKVVGERERRNSDQNIDALRLENHLRLDEKRSADIWYLVNDWFLCHHCTKKERIQPWATTLTFSPPRRRRRRGGGRPRLGWCWCRSSWSIYFHSGYTTTWEWMRIKNQMNLTCSILLLLLLVHIPVAGGYPPLFLQSKIENLHQLNLILVPGETSASILNLTNDSYFLSSSLPHSTAIRDKRLSIYAFFSNGCMKSCPCP